jgi:4-carboxymuconolactone decarboxylase
MKTIPFVLLIVVVVIARSASAQDRMPPIPAERMTDAQKAAAAAFKAARNAEVTGPFIPLLRSPEVMTRARAMGDYLRFNSVLPPRLSEFVILLTARTWTQQYEWNAHHRLALAAGVEPEVAQAIADGRRPAQMTDDEAALYDLCDELQRTHGVADATYERAKARFGEQGVVDAVGIVGYYTLLAMVLNTARTPLPAGVKPPLAVLGR